MRRLVAAFQALLAFILLVKIWIAFQYSVMAWDSYVYLLNARYFLAGAFGKLTSVYSWCCFSSNNGVTYYFELLRPPLVPFIISSLWRVSGGENFYVAAILQPIFTVAAGYTLFVLLNEMFGWKPAIISSLFMLSVPELFLWTNQILVHGEGLLFITASFLFLWRGITGKPRYYAVAGWTLALAGLARYSNLVVAALLPIFLLIVYRSPASRSRVQKPNLREFTQVLVGAIIFAGSWLPWLVWNTYHAGSSTASLQAGFATGGVYPPTPSYFYLARLPEYLGLPATFLLLIGLIDVNTIKNKARLMLVFWILAFLIFYTLIPNWQTRFFIDWTPPLAAFVGLGTARILQHIPSRSKILAWTLIALWLAGTFWTATAVSLSDVYVQEASVGSYAELMQVAGWVSANTNLTEIGATDISPYLMYTTQRMFFSTYWISMQSGSMGLTPDGLMKELNVSIVVVKITYAQQNGLMLDPNLSVIKMFTHFIIFRLK